MNHSVFTEPAIPALWPDGTGGAAGVLNIQGSTPLERYALPRPLIALAMDWARACAVRPGGDSACI